MLQLRRLLLARTEWFEQRMLRNAEADGLGHVTPAMHRLFAQMGYKPVKLSRLVEALAVSRQAVHKLVSEAVALGLVEMIDAPGDRRAKMVQFTDAGRAMVANAVRAQKEVEAEIARRIGPDNAEKLAELLSLDWGDDPATKSRLRTDRRTA